MKTAILALLAVLLWAAVMGGTSKWEAEPNSLSGHRSVPSGGRCGCGLRGRAMIPPVWIVRRSHPPRVAFAPMENAAR